MRKRKKAGECLGCHDPTFHWILCDTCFSVARITAILVLLGEFLAALTYLFAFSQRLMP